MIPHLIKTLFTVLFALSVLVFIYWTALKLMSAATFWWL